MARNKKQDRHRDDEDSIDEPKKKSGGKGILYGFLGCAGAALLLCCCGGGGGGGYAYYWYHLRTTAPLGNFKIADLGDDIKFWDFSMRLPKGMKVTELEKKQIGPDDVSICIFTQIAPGNVSQIGATKLRLNPLPLPGGERPVTWLYTNVPKFKSDPGDPIKFDTPFMPHPIEMNGLTGGRTWKIIEHKADNFQVLVMYRYHVDGFAYIFNGTATGKTKDEAMRNAEPVDAALCTFKKR